MAEVLKLSTGLINRKTVSKQSKKGIVALAAAAAVSGMYGFSSPAQAANIVKADNATPLSVGSSWVNGVVPGSGDIAQLNNGQYSNVSNPQAADVLNQALGPIVYSNLADALRAP